MQQRQRRPPRRRERAAAIIIIFDGRIRRREHARRTDQRPDVVSAVQAVRIPALHTRCQAAARHDRCAALIQPGHLRSLGPPALRSDGGRRELRFRSVTNVSAWILRDE